MSCEGSQLGYPEQRVGELLQGVASGYHTLERYAVGSKGRSSVRGEVLGEFFLEKSL